MDEHQHDSSDTPHDANHTDKKSESQVQSDDPRVEQSILEDEADADEAEEHVEHHDGHGVPRETLPPISTRPKQ